MMKHLYELKNILINTLKSPVDWVKIIHEKFHIDMSQCDASVLNRCIHENLMKYDMDDLELSSVSYKLNADLSYSLKIDINIKSINTIFDVDFEM